MVCTLNPALLLHDARAKWYRMHDLIALELKANRSASCSDGGLVMSEETFSQGVSTKKKRKEKQCKFNYFNYCMTKHLSPDNGAPVM